MNPRFRYQMGITLIVGIIVLISLPSSNAYAYPLAQDPIVSPQGRFTNLTQAISEAKDGDTIDVFGGVHSGAFSITKRLSLIGHDRPILDGENRGTVVTITGEGSVLKGFAIRNSGAVLDEENSGIAVEASNVTVEDNLLDGTLFGIYLREASNSVIRGNRIHTKNLALPRRGDPIRIWSSHNVLVERNDVINGRDVVLWYSEHLTIRDNKISGGRYGLHFMYCDDAVIERNSLIDNSVGAFLMYSRRLNLQNNYISESRGPSGYGVGLKDMDDAVLKDNFFVDNRIGAALDNSPREIDSSVWFEGNSFAYNDIGIRFSPSVRRNQFSMNSFIDNQEQVSIAGRGKLRDISWTVNGIGNYWSDYSGFDADANGIGDIPYTSQRLFEELLSRYPSFRLFTFSPTAYAIDFAARALPMVRPQPKLVDKAPLMSLPVMMDVPITADASGGAAGVAAAGILLIAPILFFFSRFITYRRSDHPVHKIPTNGLQIEIKGLTKRFGTSFAIEDLDINIRPGESVAISGPNGAGKTTVIHCILDLLPFEGSIKIGDLPLRNDAKAVRRLIGFVPQELNLHPDLTVLQTMHFYSRLRNSQSDEITKQLSEVGLLEQSQKFINQLSGGMKQRLAVGIALLSNPPVLILDEPTASLDTESRDAFLTLISRLKQDGKTLIFASHRTGDVLNLADRVLVLENGQLAHEYIPKRADYRDEETFLLRIDLPLDQAEEASRLLKERGFTTKHDGWALLVQVPRLQKARPISLLEQADFMIRDFSVEAPFEEYDRGTE